MTQDHKDVCLFAFATAMEFSSVFPEDSSQYPDCHHKLIPLERFHGEAYACVLDVGILGFSVALSHILQECKQSNIGLSAVINVGICGAYPDSDLSVLDLVRVDRERLADYGHEERNGSFVSWPTEYKSAPIESAPKYIYNVVCNLPSVVGATVNCCTGTETSAELRGRKLGCAVESMEGAACFAVCEKFGIPAFQVRGVSNVAAARDKSLWKVGEALQKLRDLFS